MFAPCSVSMPLAMVDAYLEEEAEISLSELEVPVSAENMLYEVNEVGHHF